MRTRNTLILSPTGSRQQPGTEVIDRSIAEFPSIVKALGFELQRGNRAACLICGAANKTTFSYKPDAGAWYCFRCGRGGGVLALVRAVHGYDRADALRWLADHLGVTLDDRQPLTREEKRHYAQRRCRAESQAQNLTEWRRDTLQRLRTERNPLYESENMACAVARVLLANNFGLAPLIDKPLAIISDARLSGRSDQAVIVERLLSISGEDILSVDRKHREPWTGSLPTRFLLLSNELPRLSDASGAMASRFVVLTLRNSFYGREDTEFGRFAEVEIRAGLSRIEKARVADRTVGGRKPI